MLVASMLARIPYLNVHQLRVDTDADGTVRGAMALRAELTNHVGIVHAGALFTAAETAAGVAAWQVVPANAAYVLLRAATIRYTRRAEGDVAASARVDPAAADVARTAFEQRGRADVAVDVTITDGDGEIVFKGSFDYALRPHES